VAEHDDSAAGEAEFEGWIEEALESLPPDLRDFMSNVAIVVEEEPPDGRALLGLYQGVPLTRRGTSYAGAAPDVITIYRGAGDGTFACQPSCLYGTGNTPVSIAAADLNSDSILDLATANADDDNSTLRRGIGDGTFPNASASTLGAVAPNDHPVNVAVGDFNADLNPDLAIANRDSNNVTVKYGPGFADAPGSPYPTGMKPAMTAVGDFNSDGREDMAVAGNGSDDVTVHLASTFAPGYFEAPNEFAAGDGPRAIAVGDFNSDGIEDLAIANHESATVTVRLGAGDGSFSTQAPGSPFGAGSQPSSVAVGDFNSDGIQDLAVTNEDTDQVGVRLGAGDGSFANAAAGSPFPTGDKPYFSAVADLNADGNEDIAVANSGGPSFTVRLGAGAPLLAGNLLANGGAERGAPARNTGGAPPIPSWISGAGSMTFVRYSSAGGFPRQLEAARWEGGMNHFSGGPGAALSSASQRVDVAAAAASIDGGNTSARLQADLGGIRLEGDSMQVTASFRDGADQELGSFSIGPVGAGDRKNLTTLVRRAQAATVPAGTRSIAVTIAATRATGSYDDAYADNVKLTVDAPELVPPGGGGDGGDTTPPELALSGKKVQKLGRFVRLRALCASEACDVDATGSLQIRKRRGKSSRRRLKLRSASAALAAGQRGVLKLRVPRKARRAAEAALDANAKVQAKLRVIATDAAGNTTALGRKVKLR